MADAERAARPDADNEDGERPLDFRSVVAGPEQNQGDERRRKARGQGEQQDALVEPEARVRARRQRAERGLEGIVSQVTSYKLQFTKWELQSDALSDSL